MLIIMRQILDIINPISESLNLFQHHRNWISSLILLLWIGGFIGLVTTSKIIFLIFLFFGFLQSVYAKNIHSHKHFGPYELNNNSKEQKKLSYISRKSQYVTNYVLSPSASSSGMICTNDNLKIAGTAFEDWNYYGIMNQCDTAGILGIEMYLYDCAGNLVVTNLPTYHLTKAAMRLKNALKPLSKKIRQQNIKCRLLQNSPAKTDIKMKKNEMSFSKLLSYLSCALIYYKFQLLVSAK